MDKELMHRFYLESKKMSIQDSVELSIAAKSEEEADFYARISDFFLQIAQQEAIRKGFF